jgi:hypothetical protein
MMRAFLLARATAATLVPRLSLSRLAHTLRWSRRRTVRHKAAEPMGEGLRSKGQTQQARTITT